VAMRRISFVLTGAERSGEAHPDLLVLVWMTRRYGVICFAECSGRDSQFYLLLLRSARGRLTLYLFACFMGIALN
jgi:hypothetical protein